MAKDETLWQVMKEAWTIKKKEIKEMGINPDKPWSETTLAELDKLADFMDMTTAELIDHT